MKTVNLYHMDSSPGIASHRARLQQKSAGLEPVGTPCSHFFMRVASLTVLWVHSPLPVEAWLNKKYVGGMKGSQVLLAVPKLQLSLKY